MNEVTNDSILSSVKKQLMLPTDDASFDADLILDINGVLATLNQLGVGCNNFIISGDTETWSDFLKNSTKLTSLCKLYVASKVRLIFDPPTSSIVTETIKGIIAEYEWRLKTESEIAKEEKDAGIC